MTKQTIKHAHIAEEVDDERDDEQIDGDEQISRLPSSGRNLGPWLAGVMVILLAAWGAIWWQGQKLAGFAKDWQAVFLTNGQVYFGKVTNGNQSEVILEDIYYLQVTRPLQQQAAAGEEQPNPQGELSLVKLGSELHGPTDAMHINRQQILFIEDLKDDSSVSQAINNYKIGKQPDIKQ